MKLKLFNKGSQKDDACNYVDIALKAVQGDCNDALAEIENCICSSRDSKRKSMEALVFLQVIAMMGYTGTASVLLKSLMKNMQSQKAKKLCKRTVKCLLEN